MGTKNPCFLWSNVIKFTVRYCVKNKNPYGEKRRSVTGIFDIFLSVSSRANECEPRDLRAKRSANASGVAQILRLRCAPLRMTKTVTLSFLFFPCPYRIPNF